MAVIMNDAAYMGFPLSIKRGNPAPVDTTAVWYVKADLESYAATGATAYVGQILTLVEGGKCEAYMISNEAGTLIKLASTTASGDLASDVAALQTQVTDLISRADMVTTNLHKEIEGVLAIANAKVASVAAEDASVVVGGTATMPTVKVALSASEGNALTLETDGLKVVVPDVTHPEYKLAAATTTTGMLKSYKLTKDGADVDGSIVIDIPKDMVVKSGSVATYSAGNLPEGVAEAGTYIVIVLSNDDTLYIKANGLVDVYGGAVASDKIITVNVDPATKTITATIADGSVTKAKLVKAVQDSLALADSAVQTVASGTDNGTIAVDGKDVAVTGLKDAAFATVESINTTAQGYVDTAKTALEGKSTDTDESVTIAGAKKYADKVAGAAATNANTALTDKIAELKNTDEAVDNQFVTAVKETNGIVTVERKKLVAADIPEIGQSKISGLADALAAKQNNLTFNTAYDAVDNKAATMADVNAAKSAVVGGAEDTKDSDTVKGAKLYADDKATSALNSAKAYADSIVSGDDGLSKRVDSLEGKVDVAKVSTAIETAKGEAVTAADTAADTKVAAAKTAILGKDAEGADFAHTVKEAYELAAGKTTMAAVEAKGYATKTEAQSYADAKDTAIAEAKKAGTDAQASVTALSGKVGNLPEGATATTVVGYVDEKFGKVPAQTDYTVTVTPSDVAGIAKRYTIAQAATKLNVNIDIPSDMVVKSGEVATNPAGQPEGTYLVLTLANATNDKVYINVGDLIEYVTSGSVVGDMVYIDVSADHKVTATITDGSITKTKLATSVQASLDKADSAIQAAGLTTALEPYAKTEDVVAGYVAKNGTDRLMTAAEGEKLAGIAKGAQANVIESISGVATTVENKDVKITGVSTDLLTQGVDTLILDCGGVE
jgi:hypothetical protein